MNLSALDIRKHEFPRALRGYDSQEVDAFLHMIAQQWQEMADELRRLEDRLSEHQTKLAHYMKVEEALEQTLDGAREGARIRLANAEKEAEALVSDAERTARQRLDESDAARRRTEDELRTARRDAERLLDEMQDRQARISVRLRAFLASELELLERFVEEEGEAGLPVPSRTRVVDYSPAAVPAPRPDGNAAPPAVAEDATDPEDTEAPPAGDPGAGDEASHSGTTENTVGAVRDREPANPAAAAAAATAAAAAGATAAAAATAATAAAAAAAAAGDAGATAAESAVETAGEATDPVGEVVEQSGDADAPADDADESFGFVAAEGSDDGEPTRATDEIRKIRRILEDFDP